VKAGRHPVMKLETLVTNVSDGADSFLLIV
jgi:hypothetical protein